MTDIQQRQEALIQDFARWNEWEDRYRHIINMGKSLPPMPEELKTEDNKVKGCQSQVWLTAKLNEQGQMILQGDSDALLVRGLVALLLRVYSLSSPAEVLNSPPHFLKALGFENNLSPSRSNGLHSMLKQIGLFAKAFTYLTSNKN